MRRTPARGMVRSFAPLPRRTVSSPASIWPMNSKTRLTFDVWTEADSPIDELAYTQPAMFAFEWAMAALYRSWGVVPDAVVGHSLGEVTGG